MVENNGSVSWDGYYAIQSQKAVSAYFKKWADTDFWLCRIVMCSNGYVNCDKKHFRIVYPALLNCKFKNRLTGETKLYKFSL